MLLVILFALKFLAVICQFEKRLEYTIHENQPPGLQVGHISSDIVHSQRKGDASFIDSSLTYFMRDKNEYFTLDSKTSVLKSDKTIDLESLCPKHCNDKGMGFINLVINVWKANQLRGVVQVKVMVIDQNDNIPMFPIKVFEKKIKEVLYGVGKIIELPKAIDRDITPEFNRVAYKLNEQSDIFQLQVSNDSSPRLVLLKDIDYEHETQYSMTLIAWNIKAPAEKSYLEIRIEVLDMNDCEPTFPKTVMDLMLDENTKTGKIITKLKAFDRDKNSKLTYGMIPATKQINKDTFSIKENGDVMLLNSLDVEVQNEYDLPVFATDGEFTANGKLRIIVRDINNHPPSYNLNPAILNIEENQPPQILIGQVTISDVDSAEVNGHIKCQEPQGKSNLQTLLFRPDPAENPTILKYDMYSRIPLDREEQSVQLIYLICQDGGLHERLTSTLTISLYVLDVNDNPPMFHSANVTAEIAENNAIGDKVIQVQAKDRDYKENAIIHYSIVTGPNSNMFFIDKSTGWVNVMRELDREECDRFQLKIIAVNGPLKLAYSASMTLNIQVLDKNDNHPRLKSPSQFSFLENIRPRAWIGNINADDKDVGLNGNMSFASLSTVYDHLFEVKKNGSIFSKISFDRELQERYCLNIRVSDLGLPQSLSVTGTICIVIIDANDNAPVISVTNVQIESLTNNDNHLIFNQSSFKYNDIIISSVYEAAGHRIASVTALDSDKDENGQMTFMLEEFNEEKSFASSLFMIDENDGSIKISRIMTRDHIGEYKIKIIVHDKGKPILKSEMILRIQIKDIPPRNSIAQQSIIHVTGNVLIVIILSTISAFLTALLIGAILCMIRPCCPSHTPGSTCHHNSQNITNCPRMQKPPPNYYHVNNYGQSELTEQAWLQTINRNGQPYVDAAINLHQPTDLNKIDYLNYDASRMYASQNNLCYVDHVVGKNSGCACHQGGCVRYSSQNHTKYLSHNPEEQCSDSGRGASDDDMKALNINGSLTSSTRALTSTYGAYTLGDTALYKMNFLQANPTERGGLFIDQVNEYETEQTNTIIPNANFNQGSHIAMSTFQSASNFESRNRHSNSQSNSFESLSNLRKMTNNDIQTRQTWEQHPIMQRDSENYDE